MSTAAPIASPLERSDSYLRAGVGLMSFAAVGFIGYVLGLAVALPAHYPNGFDTIGHLGLIYLATTIFVVSALLSLRALGETRS